MLWHFVKQDLRERYSGSNLGLFWLFANPLAQILIFTLIFGSIMGPRVGPGQGRYAYGFYLISGILPWTAFANTVSRTASIFVDKAGVITKIAVGLRTVALHVAVVEGIILAAVLLLYLAMKMLIGTPPAITILYLPLLIVFQQLLGFCIGLACAILTVFIRDIKEVIGLVMMVWFWLTPVVYLVADAHPLLRAAQQFNPAFWFIDQFHRVLISSQPPVFTSLAVETILSCAITSLLLWLLARSERDIRDFL